MVDKTEIVLTVNRKPGGKAPQRGHKPRKAPLKGPAPGSYLPRRKQPGGLLNFYDMGQVFNTGSHLFEDNSFPIQPAPSNSLPLRLPVDFDPISAGQWVTIASQLTSVTSRKTNFKKITKAAALDYGIQIALNAEGFESVDATNDKLTESGYKTSGSINRLRLQFHGLGSTVDTSGAVKVTNLPLYSAPGVGFSLTKSADIFIAPSMAGFLAAGVAGGNQNWIGTYYDQFPRSFLSVPTYGSFFAFSWSGSITDDTLLNSSLALLRANANNRNYFTADADHVFAGGSVPDAGAGLALGIVSIGNNFSGASNFGTNTNPGPGALLLIIETGGTTFYVWCDETRANFADAQFAVFQV